LLAGQVPFENVSESKTKWTQAATNFRNYQIAKKMNLPRLTLKINKWALLERNSIQQNDIYNIPLPRGPGPKKKKHKKRTNVGQITRGELKRRIPHEDPKYLLGTVI
jgi:hypothetical protein